MEKNSAEGLRLLPPLARSYGLAALGEVTRAGARMQPGNPEPGRTIPELMSYAASLCPLDSAMTPLMRFPAFEDVEGFLLLSMAPRLSHAVLPLSDIEHILRDRRVYASSNVLLNAVRQIPELHASLRWFFVQVRFFLLVFYAISRIGQAYLRRNVQPVDLGVLAGTLRSLIPRISKPAARKQDDSPA